MRDSHNSVPKKLLNMKPGYRYLPSSSLRSKPIASVGSLRNEGCLVLPACPLGLRMDLIGLFFESLSGTLCLLWSSSGSLFLGLYGPQEGRRHDLALFRQSNIELALEEALVIDGRQFYIYGDVAYMLRPWLQVAYDRILPTEQ